jgi:hypothetical protein
MLLQDNRLIDNMLDIFACSGPPTLRRQGPVPQLMAPTSELPPVCVKVRVVK